MGLKGTDLALLTARFGRMRFGAFRFGFAPEDVEGTGKEEPGDYSWREVKPEDDGEEWHVVAAWSMCAEKCVASFAVAASPTLPGVPVVFTDTTIPAAELTFWRWDFGDGHSSDEQNPTHTYNRDGTYPVALFVSGPRGACTAEGTVVVETPTIVEGTVTFDDGGGPAPCVGNLVELLDGADVLQASTFTDAAGLYRFTDPVVTMGDGDGFKILAHAPPPGTGVGSVDTFDDSHLWASETTQVVDIVMNGS